MNPEIHSKNYISQQLQTSEHTHREGGKRERERESLVRLCLLPVSYLNVTIFDRYIGLLHPRVDLGEYITRRRELSHTTMALRDKLLFLDSRLLNILCLID